MHLYQAHQNLLMQLELNLLLLRLTSLQAVLLLYRVLYSRQFQQVNQLAQLQSHPLLNHQQLQELRQGQAYLLQQEHQIVLQYHLKALLNIQKHKHPQQAIYLELQLCRLLLQAGMYLLLFVVALQQVDGVYQSLKLHLKILQQNLMPHDPQLLMQV